MTGKHYPTLAPEIIGRLADRGIDAERSTENFLEAIRHGLVDLRLFGGPPPPQRDTLSPRQVVVLNMIAAGLQTGEIAQTLGIAITTVRTHIAGILTKLDAKNRPEAVRVGIERGYIGAGA